MARKNDYECSSCCGGIDPSLQSMMNTKISQQRLLAMPLETITIEMPVHHIFFPSRVGETSYFTTYIQYELKVRFRFISCLKQDKPLVTVWVSKFKTSYAILRGMMVGIVKMNPSQTFAD